MDFTLSPEIEDIRLRTRAFVAEHVIPLEADRDNYDDHENIRLDLLARLREHAKAAGLWSPQAPKEFGGMGLPIVGWAAMYEEANRSIFGPVCFNCAAPDDGNMNVLARVGTPAQKEKWLRPIVEGRVRSAFAMTEPAPCARRRGRHPAGNPQQDGGAAVGRALDPQRALQLDGPLPHAEQTPMAAISAELRIHLEAPAVIPHRQAQCPRRVAEPDPDRARVGVLDRVGEGFLEDARDRRLDRSGHRIGSARHLQLEPELGAPEGLRGSLAERIGEIAVGDQRRSKIPHRLARLVQRPLRQPDHVAQRGRGGGVRRAVGHRGELQGDPGEALEQGVVDLPGEAGALLESGGEAGRQDALPGPAGRPLGAPGRGHVHHGADELHAARVPGRPGDHVHVLHPAVGHQQAMVEVPVFLVVGDPVDGLAYRVEVVGVGPSDHVLDRGRFALGVILEDPEGLLRPAQLGAGQVPAEAPRPAQALRLGEEGLALPSAASAPLRSSMSVPAPYHWTIRPLSSRSGTDRRSTQR